jgi:hypothetical protein
MSSEMYDMDDGWYVLPGVKLYNIFNPCFRWPTFVYLYCLECRKILLTARGDTYTTTNDTRVITVVL